MALTDAVNYMLANGMIKTNPIRHPIAAVSVGIWQNTPVLDLDYAEDSTCDTDLNVIMTGDGGFIEIQGTAEGEPFQPDELNAMLALARKGVTELCDLQRAALNPEA